MAQVSNQLITTTEKHNQPIAQWLTQYRQNVLGKGGGRLYSAIDHLRRETSSTYGSRRAQLTELLSTVISTQSGMKQIQWLLA